MEKMSERRPIPSWTIILVVSVVSFVLGTLWGGRNMNGAVKENAPAISKPGTASKESRLTANLYVETSAEYRACCLQTYSLAEARLRTAVKEARSHPSKPTAVVLDLDETVFDNSAFETLRYLRGVEYSDSLWFAFEEKYSGDIALVPGAKEYIERAEKLGVSVVYISNRTEDYKESVVNAMRRLGMNVNDIAPRLYLKARKASKDKSARRDSVLQRFNVLQYVGDNLRDFSESFAATKLAPGAAPQEYLAAIASRNKLVEAALPHWGVDWFILPNPVYGEWERLIPADPLTVMRPVSMR